MPSRCVLCKEQLEIGNHMFIHCSFSRTVWGTLTQDLGHSWCVPSNLLDFFCQWHGLFKGSVMQEISSWILPHFCWSIWKEINNQIFKDREELALVVGRKIFSNIKENFSVRKGGDFEIEGRKKEKVKDRSRKRQEAKWLLPPEGWHKANFDGASKGNPGSSGSGGVIRNDYGDCIAAFSLPLGFQTNHCAEANAACNVVKLAFEIGVTNLWLEGDSNNIIKCIIGNSHPSWTIANLIDETRETLAKFNRIHVTHIFWEANPVAEKFVNIGVGADHKLNWLPGICLPTDVKILIDLDKIQGSTDKIKP